MERGTAVVFAAAAFVSGVVDCDRAEGAVESSANDLFACVGGVPSGGSGFAALRLEEDGAGFGRAASRCLRAVSARALSRRR